MHGMSQDGMVLLGVQLLRVPSLMSVKHHVTGGDSSVSVRARGLYYGGSFQGHLCVYLSNTRIGVGVSRFLSCCIGCIGHMVGRCHVCIHVFLHSLFVYWP